MAEGAEALPAVCAGVGLRVPLATHAASAKSDSVLERRALPCREQRREPRAETRGARARSTATEPEVRAPLFHGPRDLSASAAKYMITLRESEETEPVGSKRKSAREVRRRPPPATAPPQPLALSRLLTAGARAVTGLRTSRMFDQSCCVTALLSQGAAAPRCLVCSSCMARPRPLPQPGDAGCRRQPQAKAEEGGLARADSGGCADPATCSAALALLKRDCDKRIKSLTEELALLKTCILQLYTGASVVPGGDATSAGGTAAAASACDETALVPVVDGGAVPGHMF